MSVSGGCQCGAVRFSATKVEGRASICHCRMCQKAMGGFFGPFVTVKVADLTWTRGERKRFQSSSKVHRGFCSGCGTPLTFEYSGKVIDIAIGVFDDPAPYRPVIQMAVESALPWVHDLDELPGRTSEEQAQVDAFQADLVSFQHPDHDT